MMSNRLICLYFASLYVVLTFGDTKEECCGITSCNCNSYQELVDKISALEEKIDGLTHSLRESIIKPNQEGPVHVLRRFDGSVDFDRPWKDYKMGFGDEGGEHWLGLDRLHSLTKEKEYGINVTMVTWDSETYYAYYHKFSVGPESDNYELNVSFYDQTSSAGDRLTYHSGQGFSAKDRNNDEVDGMSCSLLYKGGWWYKSDYCYDGNPTGLYTKGGVSNSQGMNWYKVPGHPSFYNLKE